MLNNVCLRVVGHALRVRGVHRILGGISSASGVFLAGLLFGLVEALVTIYFGSAFTQIFTFGLVILALALRPNGLFGSKTMVKV